jgi:steroid 5-alpha reductase family enzyme
MEIARVLLINFAVIVVAFLILWRVCCALGDVSVIDSFWAYGMVALAATTFVQTHGNPQRKLLLLCVCAVWGIRLGTHLFVRWRAHGADRRYVNMLGKAQTQRGWGFAKASLILVFLTQPPLLFFVCLPVQLGQFTAGPPLGIIAAVGTALAILGIIFETVSDWQLTRFKADAANNGKVLDTGLWRYTRHPNYFGDTCVWWGLYLIAAETSVGLWALPAPILLTWMLMRWSGVPILERRLAKTRPDYADYVRRTSGFVPLPPRKG